MAQKNFLTACMCTQCSAYSTFLSPFILLSSQFHLCFGLQMLKLVFLWGGWWIILPIYIRPTSWPGGLLKWSCGFHQAQSWCAQVFSTNALVEVCIMASLNCVHFTEQVPTNGKLPESFSLSMSWKYWTWSGSCSLLMLNYFLTVLGCLWCKGSGVYIEEQLDQPVICPALSTLCSTSDGDVFTYYDIVK